MSRKYRRCRVDFEILMASQEIMEITEAMELLDAEIIEELMSTMEATECRMREVAFLLKARNPMLEDIAIINTGRKTRILLLYKDKHGEILNPRRVAKNMIHHIVCAAA